MSALARPLTDLGPQVSIRRTNRPSAKYWGQFLVVVILLVWSATFLIGFIAALAILGTIGLLAAILGLRRPIVGVLGVSMLCTLDALLRHLLLTGGFLRWNTFNYWLLVVILSAVPFLAGLKDSQSSLLKCFVLLLALELVFSADLEAGVQNLLSLVSVFGLLVYLARACRVQHVWYWVGVVNGSLGAAGGLEFYLQQEQLPFVNPNAWAHFPLTAMFAVCLAWGSAAMRGRRELTLGLLAVVNGTWVFLSGSRGGLVIAICCLVFVIAKIGRLGLRVTFLAAGLLLALGLAAQFGQLKAYSVRRVGKLLDASYPLAVRTSGRSELAMSGWRLFRDHPFGVGTGSFAPVAADIAYGGGPERAAHSAWIKTLAENGIPGILLLVGYVLSFATVGWRQRRRGVFSLGLLATVTLAVAFVSTEFQTKGIWFLAAAVTIMLDRANAVQRRAHVERPGGLATSPARVVSVRG